MNEICQACGGECCKYVNIPINMVLIEDMAWMKARGHIIQNGEETIWRIPSRCQYLTDNGLCSIYDARPQTCVDYEVEGESCNRAREFAGKI
jgi:Fe-S-cluster containining protein